MGLNEKGLKVTKFGSVFFAKQSTNPIISGKVANFTIEGDAPTGWTNAGYLSLETLPNPSVDGVDQTQLGAWQRRNMSNVPGDPTVALELVGVQTDPPTLEMYNDLRKAGVPISVFILTMSPGGERAGDWWPTSMFGLTGVPTYSLTGFSSVSYKITQGAPEASLNLATIKKSITDQTAVAELFDALHFSDAAFTKAA